MPHSERSVKTSPAKRSSYLLRSRRNSPPMADHEAVNEQLKKDNEDLRKQLGEMGAQLERLITLLLEQRTNTTAGPSAAAPPEQQQT